MGLFDFLNKWKAMTPEDLQGHLYFAISWIHNDTQVKDIKADFLELKTDINTTKIEELKEVTTIVEKKPEKIVKSDNINASSDSKKVKVDSFKETEKSKNDEIKSSNKDKIKVEKDVDIFTDDITIDWISEEIIDNKTTAIIWKPDSLKKLDKNIVVKDEATLLDSSGEIIDLVPNWSVLSSVTNKKHSISTGTIVALLLVVIWVAWYYTYPKYSKSVEPMLSSIKSIVWLKATKPITSIDTPANTNTNSDSNQVTVNTTPSNNNNVTSTVNNNTTSTTNNTNNVTNSSNTSQTQTPTQSKKVDLTKIGKNTWILGLFKVIADNSTVSISELNTNFSNWIDSVVFDGNSTFKVLFITKWKADEFSNMLKASRILVSISLNNTLLTVNF